MPVSSRTRRILSPISRTASAPCRRHPLAAGLPARESRGSLLLEGSDTFGVVLEVTALGQRRALMPVRAGRVLVPASIHGVLAQAYGGGGAVGQAGGELIGGRVQLGGVDHA